MVTNCNAYFTAGWTHSLLQEIARVLANEGGGLTGREIGRLLSFLEMEDPCPTEAKAGRLVQAFLVCFKQDGGPDRILRLIEDVMNPVSYIDQPRLFELRRTRLNRRLETVGFSIDMRGRVVHLG